MVRDRRITSPELLADMKNEEDRRRAEMGEIRTNEKIEFICPKHGVYLQNYGGHYTFDPQGRKYGCDRCAREKLSIIGNSRENRIKAYNTHVRKSIENRRMLAAKLDLSEVASEEEKKKILSGEISSRDKVTFICPEHGEYEQVLGSHYRFSTGEIKHGCPKCAYLARTKRFRTGCKEKRKIPKELLSDFYYEEDKKRAARGEILTHDLVEFVCAKHGHYTKSLGDHFDLNVDPIVRKTGCSICNQGNYTSAFEKDVKEFLLSIEPSLEIEHPHYLLDLGYMRGEVDIYIPSLNLGIECNGSYYHQTKTIYSKYLEDRTNGKDSEYHLRKFLAARKQGIHLVSLYDVDWYLNSKVKRYVSGLVSKTEVIQMSDIKLLLLSRVDAIRFIEENSLSELSSSFIYYGIYSSDVLCAILGISQMSEGEFSLIYVEKLGISLQRDLSYFLERIANLHSIKSLTSYSDNDFFLGDMFRLSGFTEEETISPEHFWTNAKTNNLSKFVHLYGSDLDSSNLKKKYPELFDESVKRECGSLQEDYILSKARLYKVYRSGKIKWTKKF